MMTDVGRLWPSGLVIREMIRTHLPRSPSRQEQASTIYKKYVNVQQLSWTDRMADEGVRLGASYGILETGRMDLHTTSTGKYRSERRSGRRVSSSYHPHRNRSSEIVVRS